MDVNQIFKDLSVLVHEQGEVVGESLLQKIMFVIIVSFVVLVVVGSLVLLLSLLLTHWCFETIGWTTGSTSEL